MRRIAKMNDNRLTDRNRLQCTIETGGVFVALPALDFPAGRRAESGSIGIVEAGILENFQGREWAICGLYDDDAHFVAPLGCRQGMGSSLAGVIMAIPSSPVSSSAGIGAVRRTQGAPLDNPDNPPIIRRRKA